MLKNRILIIDRNIDFFNQIMNDLLSFGYLKSQFCFLPRLEDKNDLEISAFSPNVIFAGIDDLDSGEVVRQFKEIQQAFPFLSVIIFSTLDDDELAISCIKSGAQSFLSKSNFTPSQIFRLIAFCRERNHLQQNLNRLKSDYQNIFEHNGMPMLIANKDTRQIITANDAALRLYYYSKQEFCQLNFNNLKGDENRTFLDTYQQQLLDQSGYIAHYQNNGKVIFVEVWESELIYNNISCLLITINDVSDKVLSNIEERKAKERMDAIFNGTKDIILLINEFGNIVKVNKSAFNLLGFNEAEMQEMHISDLVNSANNKSRSFEEHFDDFFQTPKGVGVIKVKNREGSQIICSYSATKDLLPGLHLLILTDITQLEKTRHKIDQQTKKIENILNCISDGFFTVDKNSFITYWNKAAEDLFGITREKVLDKHLWNCFDKDKHESFYLNYKKVIEEHVTVYFEEYFSPMDIWLRYAAYPTREGVAVFFADITISKKHRVEIQEARNNVTAIINSSKHLIWSIDKNMKLVSFNQAYSNRIKEITGNPAVEGMQLPGPFHNKEKEERWISHYSRALQGESFSIEETIEDIFTGKIKLAEINLNPIFSADNQSIKGAACYSLDITQREESRKIIESQNEMLKVNEQYLGRLASKLEKVMNSSMDVICTLDENGNFLQISMASFFVWGYEPEELIGKSSFDFVAPQFLIATTEAYSKIIKGRVYTDFQNNYIHKNGQQVSLIWSARWDKEENMMFCVARDASAMKETERLKNENEQKISALMQNGADIVGILDEKGNYLYISPNVKAIFGYEPDSLIGKNAIELIHPSDVGITVVSLKRVLEDGQLKLAEFRHKNAFGEWRWLETVATNQLHNPAIKGIVISSRDITTRKQIEAERELMIKELLKSNADLKQFSFITSHNLRSPLSNINGILNILEYNSLDDYNRNLLTMLDKSVKQLGQTIDDLSKILIIKNSVNIEISNININDTFEKVKSVFLNTLNDLCVGVETDFQVSNIAFNSTYFESILVNLISNAIKYRSINRNLQIQLSSQYDAKGNVVFKFGDNGIGIDISRHKAKLFGLYQRFHDHIEGHGLGLFIIKSQIVALGGKIEILSEVNNGTTFIITFKSNAVDHSKKYSGNHTSLALNR